MGFCFVFSRNCHCFFFFCVGFFPDFALIIVGFRSYSCHSRDKINIKLYAANLNFKLR
jgi:hypothetical protein